MNRAHTQSDSAAPAEATVFTGVLLVFTLVLLASTFDLRPSSAFVPRLVGIPLALLLGYRLRREMAARRTDQPAGPGRRSRPKPGEAGAILWLLALPAVSTVLGFVAGPALFVFAWTRFHSGERVVVAVAASAVTAAGILEVFGRVLGTPLWPGVLGALL